MRLTITTLKIANVSSSFIPAAIHNFDNITPENVLDCHHQIDEAIFDLTKHTSQIPVELINKCFLELSIDNKSLTMPLHNLKLDYLERCIFNLIYLPSNTIKSIRFLRKNKVGTITFYQIDNEFYLLNKLIVKPQDKFLGIKHLIKQAFMNEINICSEYDLNQNSYEIMIDTLTETYSLITFDKEDINTDCVSYATETTINMLNDRYNPDK